LAVINDIQELLLEDGSSPYADWFNRLPPDVAAKVVTAKLRMQQGNLSSVEWFRGIGEYKIDYGPGWRIYLAKDGLRLIILLGGGSKAKQQRDIDRALDLWDQYKGAKAIAAKKAKAGPGKPRRKE
jgi:putative addiction module killer protein